MSAARQLTWEERQAKARGARAEQARRSLAEFLRQGWGQAIGEEKGIDLEWAPHLDAICTNVQGQLQDWLKAKRDPTRKTRVREQNARYHFPPGTLKSRVLSVYAHAWMWLHDPKWTVLCLSANDDVAKRDGQFARDLITSDWYRDSFQIPWTLRKDTDAKGKFQNSEGGWRISRKLVSKITGGRADAWIIDDPNDAFEVFSEASRRETNGKFDNAIYNRINDPRISLRILMQQHVHPDDLGNHWARKGRQMAVIYPMEYDPEIDDRTPYTPEGYDPRTEKGQTLQPDRFDAAYLAEELLRLGKFGYEAQYNQKADTLKAGWVARTAFKFFRVVGQIAGTRPKDCNTEPALELGLKPAFKSPRGDLALDWVIISVDATFGSTDPNTACNVGMMVIGGKALDRFIMADRTAMMTFPQTLDALAKFEIVDGKKKLIGGLCFEFPQASRVLVEKRANGAAVLQMLGAEVPGFVPFITSDGKHARWRATMPSIEAGHWHVLEGADWANDVITELASFPNGRYDDRVDCVSQVEIYASTTMGAVSKWEAMARR